VRDRITYRRDPVGVEMVCDARRTLERGAGDCDDKVVLLCSLLAVCGHASRFVCGGFQPDDLAHVWCEVEVTDGEWLALDPTNERAAPGWAFPFPYRLVWEIWD
jgi:transglutaminase-like putative cysteine protease